MGSEPGRESTLVEWRDWYAQILADLPTLTLDDVVISWLAHVRPNVWCLAWEPYPSEREQWPGLCFQWTTGEWWGPEGLAESHAQTPMARDLLGRGVVVGEPAFYFGGQIGHLAKLNEVAVLHKRGWQAQRSLRRHIFPGETPDDEFMWGQVLSRFRLGLSGVSRRKGSAQPNPPPDWPSPEMWVGPRRRSRAQQASLVRALLVAGLVFDGATHRNAIRTWLRWEIELSGPWSGREATKAAWELLEESRRYSGGTPHAKGKWGPKGSLDPLYALREFEQNRMGSDRQLWAAIGIYPEPQDSP
jgi:hypothetical protein